MNRRGRAERLAFCPKFTPLPFFAALLLGVWFFSRVLPAWSRSNRVGSLSPQLVLASTHRDLGTVTQGSVLRTTFPIANQGTRRLVLSDQSQGCCGQPADPRQVIVAPGDSTELTVEVDTARWHGRMERTLRYTTNDPKLPRFALTVTASVQSAPAL